MLLLKLCIIYLVFMILQNTDVSIMIFKNYPNNLDPDFSVYNVTSTIINIASAIVSIVIFRIFKNIRETQETKKLYTIIFWLFAAPIIISLIGAIPIIVFYYFSPDVLDSFNFDIMNTWELFIVINQVYIYAMRLVTTFFFIMILIREKLDYNWMVMGMIFRDIYYTLLRFGRLFRDSVSYDTGKYTAIEFAEKFPAISYLLDESLLNLVITNLWVIGIIILALFYKRQNNQIREYKKIKII